MYTALVLAETCPSKLEQDYRIVWKIPRT